MDPTPVVVWQPTPEVPGSRLAARSAVRPDHRLDDARRRRATTPAFSTDFSGARGAADAGRRALLLRGLWYSGTILAILGCHELGHYFACRYYDVDASLPFFLPVPLLLTGTLGAFIRIREPIPEQADAVRHRHRRPDRRLPRRRAGARSSASRCRTSSACRPNFDRLLELGEPLLFKLASWLLWGTPPDGYSLNMHPMAFAAWFGLLATALNLFPIGQLDGGHISYAVLGPRCSTYVTLAMLVRRRRRWRSSPRAGSSGPG